MANTRFTFKRGIRDVLVVTFDVSQLGSSGLTGYTIEWFVKRLQNQSYCNIYKTTADATEIIITDPVNGIVSVYLLPADTATLAPGDYYFGFQLTNADGTLITISPDLAQGELILLESAVV